MLIDKSFVLVGSFVVTIMVARYLGPSNLGLISYGIAIGTISLSIAQWGANYTIYDTAAKNIRRSLFFIVNTEKQRIGIFFFLYIIFIFGIILFEHYSAKDFSIVALVVLSQIFLSLDIAQYHFNATLNSRINAKSSMAAKLIAMSLRVGFVFFGLDVIWFVIPFFIEGGIIYFYRRNSLSSSISCRQKNSSHFYKKKYFNIGIPLVITGVCTTLYAKVYDIMLANFASYSDVGFYNTGIVVNAAWTFVPMAIGISFLSTVMKEKNESEQIKGFSFVLMLVIAVSIPMLLGAYIFPKEIVLYTFGEKYKYVSEILFILSVGSLCSTLGFFSNRIINSFSGGGAYLLKKAVISSFLMIVLSYFLVKNFGLIGAAYGYCLSEILNLTIFNYLFKNGIIFKIQKNLFFSFIYYKKFQQN